VIPRGYCDGELVSGRRSLRRDRQPARLCRTHASLV